MLTTPPGHLVALAFTALRATPPGHLVALAFGPPDPVDPPLPPPSRFAFVSASMPWGRQPRKLRAVRMVARDAPRLDVGVALPWGAAARVDAGAQLLWGDVPAKRQSTGLAWGAAPRLNASSVDILWRQIPRVLHDVGLPWRGGLDRAVFGAALPWRNPPMQRIDVALPWSHAPSHAARTAMAWRNPPLQILRQFWSWGQAGPVRWFVGSPGIDPPITPPPYVSTRPPGHLVALNFACPRVALSFPSHAIPLAFGRAQCAVAWPKPRRYILLNSAAVVRLPERTPIHVTAGRMSATRDNPHRSIDLDLADAGQLALLKPTEAGPKTVEINVNGYVWTAIIENWSRNRRHLGDGGGGEVVSVSGRSRSALLAAPFAPARALVVTVDRQSQQLIDDELALTGFTADVPLDWSWLVDAGAWHYDGLTRIAAVQRVAEAAGSVALAHPWDDVIVIRPQYPSSPWDWSITAPDVQIPDDVILQDNRGTGIGARDTETVTIPLWPPSATDKPRLVNVLDLVEIVEAIPHKALASAVEITFRSEPSGNGAHALVVEQTITLDPAPAVPLYNQVLVSGEQTGVSDPVIRNGTAGDVRLPSIIDPLITAHAVARERGRNALAAGTSTSATSNLWSALAGLTPTAAQRKGNVTALNADGSYTIATADGGTIRARPLPGQTWVITSGVFVRDGVIVDSAPGLPSVSQTV